MLGRLLQLENAYLGQLNNTMNFGGNVIISQYFQNWAWRQISEHHKKVVHYMGFIGLVSFPSFYRSVALRMQLSSRRVDVRKRKSLAIYSNSSPIRGLYSEKYVNKIEFMLNWYYLIQIVLKRELLLFITYFFSIYNFFKLTVVAFVSKNSDYLGFLEQQKNRTKTGRYIHEVS